MAGVAIAGATVPLTIGAGTAGATNGPPGPRLEVIATGLDNPRGLDVGPFGSLVVAESGKGGSDCVPSINPETGQPEPLCLGLTGKVSLVWKGLKLVVADYPSVANERGGEAGGPAGVAWGPEGLIVTVGGGTDPNPGFTTNLDRIGDFGKAFKTTLRGTRVLGDLAAYERSANPDGQQIDSNAFGVVGKGAGAVVADAGANDLVRIKGDGTVSTLAAFPPQLVPFPDGFPDPSAPPPGTLIPAESVPTSVAIGPDGAYYVGELTGFPFVAGSARVWRVVPGQAPTVYASGFTNIIDIGFDARGRLVVLEIAKNGLLSGDDTGALIRVARDGSRSELASVGLHSPGGLAIRGNDVFVTNNSTSAGTGEVLRVR